MTRSYFSRKVIGYLDHTDRPWRLVPTGPEPSANPEAAAAGWNGAMPVLTTPSGVPTWDSTSIIEHLDAHRASAGNDRPSVLPDDPTLRFLAHVLEDLSDEWHYRPAVGSRWSYPDNTVTAGWQIAEELAVRVPLPAATVRELVVATMTASLPRLGVTEHTIDAWMSEVVVPWFRALGPHLDVHGYLLGGRPCIADFAVFGANAAHFTGDPYCRAIVDDHGPGAAAHANRMRVPQEQRVGEWFDVADLPDSLLAVLREAGRHYLPWVAEATVAGAATVELADGVTAHIESSPFLDQARGIMLARYREARSERLDAILEEAGILRFFADHLGQATAVPDPTPPPQPTENRPYPTS